MELKTISIGEVIPYEKNPRKNDQAVDAVAESIRQCGYVAPIIVDENMVVLAGHTRLKALKRLGRKTVEIVVRDGLTEEQKKKYRILDNKTGELADWDWSLLGEELEELDFEGFDFGFEDLHFWGDEEGETNPEYEDFLEKFKPKLTTDDCFTPENVYQVIKDWAVERYKLGGVRRPSSVLSWRGL